MRKTPVRVATSEVLRLKSEGRAVEEIARMLNIHASTVGDHLRRAARAGSSDLNVKTVPREEFEAPFVETEAVKAVSQSEVQSANPPTTRSFDVLNNCPRGEDRAMWFLVGGFIETSAAKLGKDVGVFEQAVARVSNRMHEIRVRKDK
jgi:hypothetical protein